MLVVMPITIAAQGATNPDAGVIPTSPANTPQQKPTPDIFLFEEISNNIQLRPPAEPATMFRVKIYQLSQRQPWQLWEWLLKQKHH